MNDQSAEPEQGVDPSADAPDPATRARAAALLAALPLPVLLVNAQQRVEIANPVARELFGPRIAGAQVFAHLRQPEPVAALQQVLARLDDPHAANDAPVTARKVFSGSSSEAIHEMSARVLPPEAGLRGVLVSFHDVSHREEAEQQRRDFVANVSHELRSPLTTLSGFIETLQESARDDPQARERFLGIMAREAQRMAALVQDLLSLSRVESDEKIRPRGRVVLGDVLRATLAALRPRLDAAGVEVVQDAPPGPVAVPGDRDQLAQVFHNLIENALKYGGSGGRIDIETRHHASYPGLHGPAVAVSVTDHGEGIDPIHLPRLTERFYRVDDDRAREKGGTGLGLAIVKHIVNRHRGRLVMRSTPGSGSAFTVVLPCE